MQRRQHSSTICWLLGLILVLAQATAAAEHLEPWRQNGRRYFDLDANSIVAKRAITTTSKKASTTLAAPSTPSPIQSGMVANCIGWAYVRTTDACSDIISRYYSATKITQANLIKWNPILNNDCKGIKPAYFLCVQTDPSRPSATTTRTTTTTAAVVTPSPIQNGQSSQCKGWAYVRSTDTCDSIITRYYDATKITLSNLIKWNPELNSNCSGLKAQYFLCVQIDPTKSTTKLTTTTTLTISTPSPIQTGQTGQCTSWAYVRSTDKCEDIVSRYSASSQITLTNLIKWNTALKDNCSGILGGYFVCIKIDPSIRISTVTTTVTTTASVSTFTATCKSYEPTGSPQLHMAGGQVYEDIPPSFVGYINGNNETAQLTGFSVDIDSSSAGGRYNVLYDWQNFPDYITAILPDGTNLLIHDDETVGVLRSNCASSPVKRNVPKLVPDATYVDPPSFGVKVTVSDRCGGKLSGLTPILYCTYDPAQYLGGLIPPPEGETKSLNEWDEAIYTNGCAFPRVVNLANNYGCKAVASSQIVDRCAKATKWKLITRASCFLAILGTPVAVAACLEAVDTMLAVCTGINKLKKLDDLTNGTLSKALCSPPPNKLTMDVAVVSLVPIDSPVVFGFAEWNLYTGEVIDQIEFNPMVSVLPTTTCSTSTSSSSSRTSTRTPPGTTVTVATTPTFIRTIPTQTSGYYKGVPLCVDHGGAIDFRSHQYQGCGFNVSSPGREYYCDTTYDAWGPLDGINNRPPQSYISASSIKYKSPPFPGIISSHWEYFVDIPYPAYGGRWWCSVTMECPPGKPNCGRYKENSITSSVTIGYTSDFDGKVTGTWPNPWPQQEVRTCDNKICPSICEPWIYYYFDVSRTVCVRNNLPFIDKK